MHFGIVRPIVTIVTLEAMLLFPSGRLSHDANDRELELFMIVLR